MAMLMLEHWLLMKWPLSVGVPFPFAPLASFGLVVARVLLGVGVDRFPSLVVVIADVVPIVRRQVPRGER